MGGHQTRAGVLARILSSGSRDRAILHHDLRVPNDFVGKLVGHKSQVCWLKWSHDDRELASGGNDNQLTRPSRGPRIRLASVGGTADRCIRFWNTTNGHQLSSVDTGSQVCNLMWSRNVNELVSTHGYSQNQIMTIVTGAGDETLRFRNVFPSVKTP
ncbi:hypothetical protein CRG98_007235, partial [Punica granatum]